MQRIAVIGGGITGITSAYALAKRGYQVTVFEKHRYAAMETSFANGGQLSASNAEVWNHWPTVIKGLRWMLRNDAPLLVNPARAGTSSAGLASLSPQSPATLRTRPKPHAWPLPPGSTCFSGQKTNRLISI
ncbi:hypothetical protein HSBAA_59920 [Vreelandella sulfidaeris]|uniref:FAD dependent oxidoreductase domain-containing protein n=1 Tax=Vreelandella sulfidaeris TaxID=115553 RepID=A0A455UEG9_9GAMM|nr:hypothetical protein HSBAA_59920 [Halomonas sulfidaeris]